ncbi:hypothetical protein LO763_04515 [Glycomyces sp. A-F 0318]|uniref:hypothetical protein n=1 Tax=Glycomyces amatae TaxID=2881355 RepID=UPI001E4593B3|nr:hypothetical protein [Glycomyces amatae]MCD0442887.1 hypothetical protein [Glycomyces amatae]
MDFMRRNARWIALAALLAMAAPFLAQGLNALFAVDTFLVAAILLLGVVVAVVALARSQRDEE